MVEEVRKRAACDRCHSQKLRCPRRPGVEVCDRCLKARSSCVYSPFRQKKNAGIESLGNGLVTNPQISSVGDGLATLKDAIANTGSAGSKRRRPNHESLDISQSPFLCLLDSLTQFSLDIEPDLMFGYPSAQTDPIIAGMGNDWMSNSFPLSQDFGGDCAFADMNLDIQNPYAEFDFNPNSQMLHEQLGPKSHDLIRLRSPKLPSQTHEPSSNLLLHPDLVIPAADFPDKTLIPRAWGYEMQEIGLKSVSESIRKLSELSIKLYEHGATVPPQSIHDDPEVANMQEGWVQDYSGYRFDETFQVTQDLIDLYPSAINACTSPESHQSTSSTPSTNSSSDTTPSTDSGTPSDAPPSKNSSIDHSVILLVLSCHLRLIDIYEKLFKHMDKCIEKKGVGCALHRKNGAVGEPAVNIGAMTAPTLTIGSYAPPPSSAVPMQMLLLLQLASQLASHASDLEAQVKDGEGHRENAAAGNIGGAFHASWAAAENLKGRANNMTRELGELRGKMLQSGLLA